MLLFVCIAGRHSRSERKREQASNQYNIKHIIFYLLWNHWIFSVPLSISLLHVIHLYYRISVITIIPTPDPPHISYLHISHSTFAFYHPFLHPSLCHCEGGVSVCVSFVPIQKWMHVENSNWRRYINIDRIHVHCTIYISYGWKFTSNWNLITLFATHSLFTVFLRPSSALFSRCYATSRSLYWIRYKLCNKLTT